MNDWDRDNLNFILNTTDEDFVDWMEQADAEDIDYAIRLIHEHKQELSLKETVLLDEWSEEQIDLTEANDVLSKFRLK